MNRLSRLTALLLALLMLLSNTAFAEAAAGISFDDFNEAAYLQIQNAAVVASEEESYTDPLPLEQCSGTYYDEECFLDEIRSLSEAERYTAVNGKASYYYAHYINYHSDTKLLCECGFPMYEYHSAQHLDNSCPWHPNYGEEPKEEITLALDTLTFEGENGLYASAYGQLPVGATLTAETVENDFGVQGALASVKLTVKTADGNVWQPTADNGTYRVIIEANGLPESGLSEVYLTTGEEGAYKTNAYGVTQFTSGGVDLTLSSFGIVTMVEYILKETTEDGTTVSISGDIPANVSLELVSVSMDVIEAYIPGANNANVRKVALDIALVDGNGDVWQPGEAVTVTVNAKDLGEAGDLIVLHHIHDEQVECIGNAVMDSNGDITFTMDGFSYIYAANASDDPTVNCGDTDCIVDELANTEKYPTELDRYNYFMGLCKTDSNAANYYAHYRNSSNHQEADLLCECIEDYYSLEAVSAMLPPGDEGHTQSICPWHPNYGEEPEEEITLTEQTLTFGNEGDGSLYAYVYGKQLPVGATLTVETLNAADFVSDAVDNAVSVKLTVKTARGNVWQPESGSYSARIEVPGIPTNGLASVYLTTGEEGAYETSAYGVTTISGGGVDLTIGSFGIVTMAEYILEEATADGTTVSVGGGIPDGVDLTVETVDAAQAETYLPGISTMSLPYVALDIKLVNEDGTEWQPADGEKLKVSISAEKIGVDGDSVAIFHHHDDVTNDIGRYAIASGEVSFTVDGFSLICAVNTEVDYCYLSELKAMATPEERWEYLSELAAADLTTHNKFVGHYHFAHSGEGVICECYANSFYAVIYEPWSSEHISTSCPWHPDNKPSGLTQTLPDGTTVTVSGNVQEDVALSVSTVEESVIKQYIPTIDTIAARKLLLDVKLLDENDVEVQPEGEAQVEISANNLGENGDVIALFHISNGVVEYIGTKAIADGKLTYTTDNFSYVVGVNIADMCTDGEDCAYDAFVALEIAEREAELARMYNADTYHTEYNMFIGHVLSYHGTGEGVCLCVDYHPDTHGYGTIAHTTATDTFNNPIECSWAFKNLTADEQYDVYKELEDDETKLDYLEELTEDQQEALKSVMTPDEQVEMEELLAYAAWLADPAVQAWLADASVTVTPDMLKRAYEVHTELTLRGEVTFTWSGASRLEGTELYDVYTGVVLADYDQATGELRDRATALLVGTLDLTSGEIIAPANLTNE